MRTKYIEGVFEKPTRTTLEYGVEDTVAWGPIGTVHLQ